VSPQASEPGAEPLGPSAVQRELVATWALCIAGIGVAQLLSRVVALPILAGNLAGVAALLFIALPDRTLLRRRETWSDHGLPWWGWRDARSWQAWGKGVAIGLAVCALVFPPFFATFWAFGRLLPRLPAWAAHLLAPYGKPPEFHFRLPVRFPLLVVNQFLVVALPEEMFYRGWMQTRWAATAPERQSRVLGAALGAGFLSTHVLFALGHLVVFQVWRLATFFPGLLFGWLRARTGNIAASVVVHALSNVFIQILEASFYG
jgi:membrane protease YdiL (CAAX protease family)